MDRSVSNSGAGLAKAESLDQLPPRSRVASDESAGQPIEVDSLDNYQIVGKLGAGGMGTVWRAIERSTRRQVALKILNAGELACEAARLRFAREIEVAASLDHANIARVYSAGIHKDAYFYAMELIDGVSLDEHLRQCNLNRQRAISLMIVICRAVQYAHQNGVIHRDLKPSNILVDKSNDPHIVDFGLGKLLSDQMPSQTITVQGEWAGTPSYMSPEQAAGKSNEVDTRTDIYSLGVILYEIVTGHLPHSTEGGHLAILQRVVHDEIIRPRKLCPAVDADLEALLLKALARKPDDRYSSAAALADDLDNYLNGNPLSARRPTLTYVLRKKIAKHRAPISMAAILIVGMIAIGIYSSIRIAHERDAAIVAAKSETALRHVSNRRLADSLILVADNFARDRRWPDAAAQFREARRIELAEGVSPTNAELGLLDAMRHNPKALIRFSTKGQWPFGPLGAFFDSDGHTIWVQMPNGIVQAYDPSTGRLIRSIGNAIPDEQVTGVFDSSDGDSFNRIVSRHDSKSLSTSRIEEVNLHDGAIRQRLKFGEAFGSHVAIWPNGREFAGVSRLDASPIYRRQFNLWLSNSEGEPQLLARHGERLRAIALSPDTKTLATGDDQGHLRFWNTATQAEIHFSNLGIGAPGSPGSRDISCLQYTPDGSGILVGDAGGNVGFLQLSPTLQPRRFGTSDGPIQSLVFSSSGQLALSGDEAGNVCLWDVQSGELRRVFSAGSAILSIRFSPDNRMVLASDADGTVSLWPIDLADQAVLCQCPAPATCVAISPNDLLAAVGALQEAEIIDMATGCCLHAYTLPESVTAVAFATDGSMLDVATTDGAIRRFEVFGQWRRMADYDSAAVFQAIPNLATIPASRHQANVSFATSSNRAMFVTNYCAIVLDCNNGSRVATFDGRLERLGAISPDGRKAIAITDGSPRTMKVIDSQNGLATDVPLPGFSFVQALAVSADSTTAFVAYKDCTIQAIDLVNARQLWTVPSRQQILKSLAVSPDGATFISASEDGTLRFRSTSDGRELRELATGANLISAAAFSPLGDRILSGGAAQNGVFVWDLSRPGR